MDVDLDWSWVEPTLDLALECILMPAPPPVQMLPMRTARGAPKMHDNWSFAERYQWLMTNHPGSGPERHLVVGHLDLNWGLAPPKRIVQTNT